jgi:hypothetical protein
MMGTKARSFAPLCLPVPKQPLPEGTDEPALDGGIGAPPLAPVMTRMKPFPRSPERVGEPVAGRSHDPVPGHRPSGR